LADQTDEAKRSGPLADSEQLVLVTSPEWSSPHGRLELHERRTDGTFHRVDVWQVNLGSAGMAWGTGLHGVGKPPRCLGPTKQEGDQTVPAGVFRLGTVFGYDDKAATDMPYQRVSESWRCIDDPKSEHYNSVVDANSTDADWESAEVMRREDERYRWALWVEHNAGKTKGAGSCIFLHVEGAPGTPTVGCTSMGKEKMAALIAWLDPRKKPVFAVLP